MHISLLLNIYLTHPLPCTKYQCINSNPSSTSRSYSTSSFQVSQQLMMLNTKKLIEMARKSQKVSAAFKRTVSGRSDNGGDSDDVCSTSSVASKGHVFVYTIEGNRFMIPLEYLSHNIFRELFRISEEEYGLPRDGPITLPIDATCMDYIISLILSHVSRDIEKALLTSIANNCCKDPFSRHGHFTQQLSIVYGF